ncbi:EF-hand [Rhizoclosmatium globosum]|uniref:EF-hand n=1 Tax=Rhizoclosmatium globosum TaxID=329046 RepID=A0A1Y2CSR3_9FUNG|nr:EF-hand [Rhizoclosmatium globosum]|eukprot:ORY49904.1 EF-hand [Rhizoclosmatium globosum]
MKVKWGFLKRLHLDHTYGLLTARSAYLCFQAFNLLDWRGEGSLDDVQFHAFMSIATDLTEKHIYKVFDIFDLDRSGSVEFDEFYLLTSILVAIKDNQGKQFMYQHWRTCFEILDEDGGRTISLTEFCTLGFLFNFTPRAIQNIYKEFDVAGNMELDYSEFRLFVLAAIEMQKRLDNEIDPLPTRIYKYVQSHLQKMNLPFLKKGSEEDVNGQSQGSEPMLMVAAQMVRRITTGRSASRSVTKSTERRNSIALSQQLLEEDGDLEAQLGNVKEEAEDVLSVKEGEKDTSITV